MRTDELNAHNDTTTTFRRSAGTNDLQQGDFVEYYSETHATWVDATIAGVPNKTNSQGVRVYHLDIKQNAAVTKIRFKEYLIGTQVIYRVGGEEFRAEIQSKADINVYRVQYHDKASSKSRIAETHVRRLKPVTPSHAKGAPPNNNNNNNNQTISQVLDSNKHTLVENDLIMNNRSALNDIDQHRSISQKSSVDYAVMDFPKPETAKMNITQRTSVQHPQVAVGGHWNPVETRTYGKSHPEDRKLSAVTNQTRKMSMDITPMPRPNSNRASMDLKTGYADVSNLKNTIGGEYVANPTLNSPTKPRSSRGDTPNKEEKPAFRKSITKNTGYQIFGQGGNIESPKKRHTVDPVVAAKPNISWRNLQMVESRNFEQKSTPNSSKALFKTLKFVILIFSHFLFTNITR